MPETCHVIAGNLGSNIATFITHIDGHPVAVINSQAAHHSELRTEAAYALVSVGLDAGLILGALHGVRR